MAATSLTPALSQGEREPEPAFVPLMGEGAGGGDAALLSCILPFMHAGEKNGRGRSLAKL